LVSGCESEEVVDLQEQESVELSEKKLFCYHRYKIKEYKWRRNNWGLIKQMRKTAELLQKILDVDLNLFRNFRALLCHQADAVITFCRTAPSVGK
jgi:hypothetical protein